MGDRVEKGDLLIKAEIDKIRPKVPSIITPVLVSELTKNQKIRIIADGEVNIGDDLYALDVYE